MSRLLGWLILPAVIFLLAPWAGAALGVRHERRAGHLVVNYRGDEVPLGLGWAWLALGVAYAALGVVTGLGPMPGILVAGVASLGWLDDRFGAGGPKGFRGHLAALREGRVTTGLVKLAGIGAFALATAYRIARPALLMPRPTRIAGWLLIGAVIALTANLVNLLDLRPGRALKAYAVVALPAALANAVAVGGGIALSWRAPAYLAIVAAVALGPAVVCLPADLRERAMLGDMGANAAGALAGYTLVEVLGIRAAAGGGLPLAALAGIAALLFALNLASERVSFSAVIEGNTALRWVDSLGRRKDVRGVGHTTDSETGT